MTSSRLNGEFIKWIMLACSIAAVAAGVGAGTERLISSFTLHDVILKNNSNTERIVALESSVTGIRERLAMIDAKIDRLLTLRGANEK